MRSRSVTGQQASVKNVTGSLIYEKEEDLEALRLNIAMGLSPGGNTRREGRQVWRVGAGVPPKPLG